MLTSVQNPLVRQMAGLKDKKGREASGLFLVEGVRFVEEALESGVEVVQVMYSPALLHSERGQKLLAHAAGRKLGLHTVSDKVLGYIADTENPQGVVAAVRVLAHSLESLEVENPVLVVVDGVQDPGNLGTIIRTAVAAGAHAVLCTQGSVDIYNPKTMRSTMGAVFKIPCIQGLAHTDLVNWLKKREIPILIAEADGEEVYYSTDLLPPLAVVIGSEGSGPSEFIMGKATRRIRIPLSNEVESLNAAVAAALLLFESKRQRTANSKFL